MVTSGIRLGAPAGTTRGFGVAEFQEIGRMIAEVLDGLAKNGEEGNGAVEAEGQGEGDRRSASASRSTPDRLTDFERSRGAGGIRAPLAMCGH